MSLWRRLREFDWYGPPRKGADELLNEAANRIERADQLIADVIESVNRREAPAGVTIQCLREWRREVSRELAEPESEP